MLADTAPARPKRIGGALIETGMVHERWPRTGERVELWSGLAGCTDRVTQTVHWLVDPASGKAFARARSVGVALDLEARRLVVLTPEAQSAFRAACVPL